MKKTHLCCMKINKNNFISVFRSNSDQDKGSIGHVVRNRKIERMNSDNQENINTSNMNLLSSNSSQNRNNITKLSSNDIKNLSGSGNFADSQNELTKTNSVHSKEYPSKKIKINLFEEYENSVNVDCTLNSNGEYNRQLAGNITAPSTCTNSRFIGGASGTALSKRNEQNCIERSIEFKKSNSNSGNAALGLPPSGQNAVQKSNIFEKADPSKIFNNQQITYLKRNFSTNNIGRTNSDENSRNRFSSRKSIPSTHLGENLPNYENIDHTVQIYSSRKQTFDDDFKNEEGNRTERRSSVGIDPRGDTKAKVEVPINPTFKRFIQENVNSL